MSLESHQHASEHPVLALRNIVQSFDVRNSAGKHQELRAVDTVSLELRQGEVLAIVGESGSGKTTLGRMMLRFTKPKEGDILLDGAPLDSVDTKALSRRIQPIFQDPYSSLNSRKTIEQIIATPLHIHKIGDKAERRRKVEIMLDRVGLARHLLNAYPMQLSGGQRQRVAIARALIMNPEIVICDEPTSALDVSVQAQILNLLKTLRDEFKLTYLFISHNLAVVEFIADRIGVMYLGRLVELGTTEQVLERPRHPYTKALLESVLTPDPSLGLPDPQLGNQFPNPLDPPSGCRFHPRCSKAMDICRSVAPRPLKDASGLVECHLYDTPAAG